MVYYGVWHAAAAVINFPRQNEFAIEANITAGKQEQVDGITIIIIWLGYISFPSQMTTITIIIAISISIPGFGNNSVDGGSDDS